MNGADTRLLVEFLESPERPDGTLRFHELQGFLFAIASSPQTIAPSEWLPMIGNDQSLDFAVDQAFLQYGLLLRQIGRDFGQTQRLLDRAGELPLSGVVSEVDADAPVGARSLFAQVRGNELANSETAHLVVDDIEHPIALARDGSTQTEGIELNSTVRRIGVTPPES